MSIFIANIIFRVVGIGCAYWLLKDTRKSLARGHVNKIRWALAFVLMFFSSWFAGADPQAQLLWYDWLATIVLSVLALIALIFFSPTK